MSFQAVWRHEVAGSVDSRRETLFDCLCRVMRVVWANPLTWSCFSCPQPELSNGCRSRQLCRSFARHVGHMLLGYALFGNALTSLVACRSNLRLFNLASGLILS